MTLTYQDTLDCPDPRAQLAAAIDRETHLLNQVSTAHSTGWRHASRQALGLLEHAYTDAHPGARTGLAVAIDIARTLPGQAPADTDHRLDLTITPGQDRPEFRVTCSAPVGSSCRQACPGTVDGRCWLDVCQCDGSLVDADHCLAAQELEGEADLFEAYVGPARDLERGPILVRYSRTEGWSWMFAADLPAATTAREWAEADQ